MLKIWQNHASRLDIWIFHVSRLSAWIDYRLLSGTSSYPEIMGSLLICISKMAVSLSQKFLQRFLKEISGSFRIWFRK
jgi:hypothetical protein